eukprot:COSAG06_NODE_11166_length_1552_cov_14.840703_1_plen_144_part_00
MIQSNAATMPRRDHPGLSHPVSPLHLDTPGALGQQVKCLVCSFAPHCCFACVSHGQVSSLHASQAWTSLCNAALYLFRRTTLSSSECIAPYPKQRLVLPEGMLADMQGRPGMPGSQDYSKARQGTRTWRWPPRKRCGSATDRA